MPTDELPCPQCNSMCYHKLGSMGKYHAKTDLNQAYYELLYNGIMICHNCGHEWYDKKIDER